jgi:hypothetical protein
MCEAPRKPNTRSGWFGAGVPRAHSVIRVRYLLRASFILSLAESTASPVFFFTVAPA